MLCWTYRIDEVVGEYPEVNSYMENSEPDDCTDDCCPNLYIETHIKADCNLQGKRGGTMRYTKLQA